MRSIFKVILAKCDLLSENDIKSRSQQLRACVGRTIGLDYQNLSHLIFRLIEFDGFSFIGVNFTKSSFQGCKFRKCSFDGSQLVGTQFYECEADEETGAVLRALRVETVVTPQMLRPAKVTVTSRAEDPVLELVVKFFKRFIRDQRGTNQRTARDDSFFSGLGGEERKFTEREIIPEMRKAGVIFASRSFCKCLSF